MWSSNVTKAISCLGRAVNHAWLGALCSRRTCLCSHLSLWAAPGYQRQQPLIATHTGNQGSKESSEMSTYMAAWWGGTLWGGGRWRVVVLSNARHTGILSAHLQLEQVGLGCGESCGYQGRGCCPQVGSARARNCQGTLGARLGSRPTPGGAGAAPGCT